jgi:hypothetical protein
MKRTLLATLFVSATAVAGSYLDNSKTATHDCSKDPTADVAGNSNTITFTGECTKISVQGNQNTLSIASVKELVVAGNKNTVAVEATDSIRAPGSDNKVTWKKPIAEKNKKPAIANPGKNSKISQAN